MLEPNLRIESEKLARSWLRHDPGWLNDYLVAGVEDPRYNLQSIFSRHFLVYALAGNRFEPLMEQEYRFAAALNWFLDLGHSAADAGELLAVLHALKQGADNAEGREIPRWVVKLYQSLPAEACGTRVANYLEPLLAHSRPAPRASRPAPCALPPAPCALPPAPRALPPEPCALPPEPCALPPEPCALPPAPSALRFAPSADSLDLFAGIWREVLQQIASESGKPLTVLEPACGSANDYRFLDAYGLTPFLDYTGFDLCERNIENARQRFPSVRFEVGNVFAIAAPDRAYDVCFVHDLLEHLSPEGLEQAVAELCRVTRRGLCVNFFQMHEMPDHLLRPVDEYYWNTLSLDRVRELFLARGFAGQVFHIGRFLRDKVGADTTHNPNAYTFLLQPRRPQ